MPQLHREVVVAPGVVFFVTLDEGYEYVGTNPVDEALRDRMTYSVRMGSPPRKPATASCAPPCLENRTSRGVFQSSGQEAGTLAWREAPAVQPTGSTIRSP